MSNFAALIPTLSISGSRLSDGTPNASGEVWFFEPDTNTTVNVYSDAEASAIVTQPITLGEDGKLPSEYPDGVYATQPVRILIQDVDGNTVTDNTYIPGTAGNVGVDNEAFTGTTMDEVLTAALTSLGGADFKYKESAGATARTVKAKFAEIWISVKDFGAVGDGVADDTTAIQAAISRVKALGGGVVYFPPGTYLVSAALTLTAGTGVSMVGIRRATTLVLTHATADLFTFATSATKCGVYGLRMMHATVTAGAAINVAGGVDFVVKDCEFVTGDFVRACDFSGATNWAIIDSMVNGTTNAVRSDITATGLPSIALNSQFNNSGGTAILLDNAGGDYTFVGGAIIAATTGISFGASFSGGPVTVLGMRNLATTAYDMSGLSTDPTLRRIGDGVDGYVTTQASGGGGGSSFTPNRAKGPEMHLRLTSGGAATCTINAPTPTPPASMRNVRFTTRLTAAAGGNITWRFNAVFVLVGGGTDIAAVDGTTITVEWEYDVQTSEWRECFRAQTTT